MQSAITHLFAGVPVSDLDTGIDWYTRFFGRPDMRVGEEMLWEIDEYAWLFIEPSAAGGRGPGSPSPSPGWTRSSRASPLRRIEHEPIETYSNGVRHVNVPDPTGTRSRSPSRPRPRARHLARLKPGLAGGDRGLLASPLLARFASQLIAVGPACRRRPPRTRQPPRASSAPATSRPGRTAAAPSRGGSRAFAAAGWGGAVSVRGSSRAFSASRSSALRGSRASPGRSRAR